MARGEGTFSEGACGPGTVRQAKTRDLPLRASLKIAGTRPGIAIATGSTKKEVALAA